MTFVVKKGEELMQPKGIGYLQRKLECKRERVNLRYAFYEMKNHYRVNSQVIPNQLEYAYKSCLGWCEKAVDSLADRLVFKEFENDNFGMGEIFDMNNPDILFDSAILGALISACDFIYITKDENGFPRMQIIDGGNATGIIDPITNMLTEGYAVLKRDENDSPISEAYFLPYKTIVRTKGERGITVVEENHNAPYALLVPVINKPDARRPFGHSRITRACMSLQEKAKQTITRGDITAEFYSFPQKYVTGLSQDAEPLDAWRAAVSSMLQFSKDDDGDKPTLGQFQQQTFAPHIEQFKMYASAFAGETGLTLDDLGFVAENPSSSEAIKASHETLRLQARKAQRYFGTAFRNAGYLAACVRDNIAYERKAIYETRVIWEPVFEPDGAAISVIGDGLSKINSAIPGYVTEKTIERLTGIKSE